MGNLGSKNDKVVKHTSISSETNNQSSIPTYNYDKTVNRPMTIESHVPLEIEHNTTNFYRQKKILSKKIILIQYVNKICQLIIQIIKLII